jgi:hypothetical protein
LLAALALHLFGGVVPKDAHEEAAARSTVAEHASEDCTTFVRGDDGQWGDLAKAGTVRRREAREEIVKLSWK